MKQNPMAHSEKRKQRNQKDVQGGPPSGGCSGEFSRMRQAETSQQERGDRDSDKRRPALAVGMNPRRHANSVEPGCMPAASRGEPSRWRGEQDSLSGVAE